MTTTKLRTPRRREWYDLPVPTTIAICVFALIAIAALVGQIRSDAPAAVAVPTPALLIVYPTAAPTAVPLAPTPDPAIYAELEQLRRRVAELEQQAAAPPPQPEIVYQVVSQPAEQPAPAEYAAPTPEPPAPTLAPQQLVILDRGAWAEQAAAAHPVK